MRGSSPGSVYLTVYRRCRFQLTGRLPGSQSQQSDPDDGKDRRTRTEADALGGIAERLNEHDRGVREARPGGECDQAAMFRWIACSCKQKNSERDVEAKQHRLGVGLRRLPENLDHSNHGRSEKQSDHD